MRQKWEAVIKKSLSKCKLFYHRLKCILCAKSQAFGHRKEHRLVKLLQLKRFVYLQFNYLTELSLKTTTREFYLFHPIT